MDFYFKYLSFSPFNWLTMKWRVVLWTYSTCILVRNIFPECNKKDKSFLQINKYLSTHHVDCWLSAIYTQHSSVQVRAD